MDKREFQKILTQIDELKALFIFAQRVIPYLEELILFIKETTPLLEEVNNSIVDSSNKMPVAVKQLDKVSATTEMATSDILDGIDRMLEKLDRALKVIEQEKAQEQERLTREKELILKLAETLDGEEETRAARVEEALTAFFEEHANDSVFQQLHDLIFEVQSETYEIMNLLQVQDISTQQIMAANALIESVQHKLSHLLVKFGMIPKADYEKKERSFDPNAIFEDRSHVQEMADRLLAGDEEKAPDVVEVKTVGKEEIQKAAAAQKERSSQDKASQEEIDRLFNELKVR